jgi:hypothetical protein
MKEVKRHQSKKPARKWTIRNRHREEQNGNTKSHCKKKSRYNKLDSRRFPHFIFFYSHTIQCLEQFPEKLKGSSNESKCKAKRRSIARKNDVERWQEKLVFDEDTF